MNRFVHRLMPILLVGAVAASGQGRRGPQPSPTPQHSGLNMTALQVIAGTVTDADVAVGAQYPTIVINKVQIKVAPAWFLLDNDIEIKTGDNLKVTVAPSVNAADTYFYAIDITKATAFLKLRDGQGFPLWTRGPGVGNRQGNGPGNGAGNGTGECQGCIDLASITTVTGTVDKVTIGAGIQFPAVVLKTGDNKLLTIKIGPERVLLAADFEIAAGQKLTIKYAGSTCKDELVALEITDSNGRTVVLRGPDGIPAWN